MVKTQGMHLKAACRNPLKSSHDIMFQVADGIKDTHAARLEINQIQNLNDNQWNIIGGLHLNWADDEIIILYNDEPVERRYGVKIVTKQKLFNYVLNY